MKNLRFRTQNTCFFFVDIDQNNTMFLITQQSFNIVRNENEIIVDKIVVENQIQKIVQIQKIDDNNSNEKFVDQKTQSRDQEYDIETQLIDFLDRHRYRTF